MGEGVKRIKDEVWRMGSKGKRMHELSTRHAGQCMAGALLCDLGGECSMLCAVCIA